VPYPFLSPADPAVNPLLLCPPLLDHLSFLPIFLCLRRSFLSWNKLQIETPFHSPHPLIPVLTIFPLQSDLLFALPRIPFFRGTDLPPSIFSVAPPCILPASCTTVLAKSCCFTSVSFFHRPSQCFFFLPDPGPLISFVSPSVLLSKQAPPFPLTSSLPSFRWSVERMIPLVVQNADRSSFPPVVLDHPLTNRFCSFYFTFLSCPLPSFSHECLGTPRDVCPPSGSILSPMYPQGCEWPVLGPLARSLLPVFPGFPTKFTLGLWFDDSIPPPPYTPAASPGIGGRPPPPPPHSKIASHGRLQTISNNCHPPPHPEPPGPRDEPFPPPHSPPP